MDRGAWQATVPGVTKSQILLNMHIQSISAYIFIIYGCPVILGNQSVFYHKHVQSLGQEDTLEKEMTTHSSILAWKIPWTEEPGGVQSVGSQVSDTT